VSLVLSGATVVTMDAGRRVLEKTDVLVEGPRIARVGRIRSRKARRIDARGCVVMPGFVQAHVHLCQTLFRGLADDLALLPWLKSRIWPLEAAHDRRSLRVSARLGIAEMLLAGTTTILDMGTVHHHEVVFAELEKSGLRAFSGKAMMDLGDDVPAGLRETTAQSLEQSNALCDRWNGAAGGRLGYAYAPRFILSCSEALLRGAAEAARARGALLHSHVAEHADERAAVKDILGEDDVAALARFGLSGPDVILAHGVQLRKSEMRKMAKAGTRVVHCPSANLKLASGIAQVPAMREAGMVVALGADGAPCNNRMDPWLELREAALLAKVRMQDAAALPASEALALATIEGARALGIDDEVGSVEEGKRADLCVVRVDGLTQAPARDVYGTLVYATDAHDVRHVLVDGELLVEDGRSTRMDPRRIAADARREATKVMERAALA